MRGVLLALALLFAAARAVAAVTHVASSDVGGSVVRTDALTLTVPTGTQTGDLLLAVMAQDDDNTLSTPSGWTSVLVSNGTQPLVLRIWYRVATAADVGGSKTYTFRSNADKDAYGGISAFRGVDTSAPIAASGIQANGNGSSTSVAPSISPASTNTMLVAFWANEDKSLTQPAGMTATVGAPGGRKNGGVNLLSAYEPITANGATGTRTATAGGGADNYGALVALKSDGAAASVDHYQLSMPSTGVACASSTVTVTACANASSPCTSAATNLAGQTVTLATSAGTLAATTLTFDASGIATTTLSHPAAANGASVGVTLSGESTAASNPRQCCPDGSACTASSSCSTTFSTAGFIVAAASGGAATTIPAQTAGTNSAGYVLRAVRTNTQTMACEAALAGSQAVNWALQCLNPSTCSAGNRGTLTGSAATAIASNPASGITGTTAVTMNFDAGGNAPFSILYADVGQVQLRATMTVGGATLSGSSNAFVVKPASFSVTGITQTAAPNTPNPAAASASGGVFVKAGESFSATVTALTSGGATAPNFGRESAPEGVLLSPTLVLPAGGTNGTLGNATIGGGSFSAGAATVTNLTYSEVGIVTLTPSVADGDYLGAGAVGGGTSGNVGRFVPARLVLSAPSLTHRVGLGCTPASAFSYLGENFRLAMTLTAQNLGGQTTTNYTGAFARFDPTNAGAWGLAGIAGSTVFSTTSGRLSLGTASGTWGSGVLAGATLGAAALRAAAPDGPFDAVFGVAPTDADGVALAALDLDTDLPANGPDRATVATVALRFGRLRLANGIGAADRPLALALRAESWDGTGFALNALDNCSTVPTAAMNLGNRRGSLLASDVAPAGPVTLAAGAGRLQLTAPGGGRSGTLDLALSLGTSAPDAACLGSWSPAPAATAGAGLAALRSNWCSGSHVHDPAARVTFGGHRGSQTIVDRRENF